MPIPPAAFLSYVRLEDQHEEGRITQLKQRLEGEVRMQTGWREFKIFQDPDIHWGQEWQARLAEAIEAVTFFIPILTPLYFRSEPCRDELEQFLARERALGRGDLILPIYYVDAPILNDPVRRERDPLAATLAARQLVDWRDLRHEPLTDPRLAKTLAGMAVQIREALERSQEAPPKRPEPRTDRPSAPSRPGASAEETSAKTSESRKGPSSKVEPPTHVVDAWHRGDFTTISAAIEAAKPGDRILVRPGLYQEGLVIEKPLEILGDGPVEEIEIQSVDKAALLFRAGMGRVANLTLRQMGGGGCGVDIAQGRLELEGCDIRSLSWVGIAIHSGADPRLRRNRIHDGESAGVYIYENGRGTLEDNDIFGNAEAGVAICGGGNPVLRRNRIHDQERDGVEVYEKGQGTLEDNDIFGNAFAGVSIREDSNPILRRNRIHKGKARSLRARKFGGDPPGAALRVGTPKARSASTNS